MEAPLEVVVQVLAFHELHHQVKLRGGVDDVVEPHEARVGQLLERVDFPEDTALAAVGEFGLVVDFDGCQQTSRPVESLLDRGVGPRAKVTADLVVADLGKVEGLEL